MQCSPACSRKAASHLAAFEKHASPSLERLGGRRQQFSSRVKCYSDRNVCQPQNDGNGAGDNGRALAIFQTRRLGFFAGRSGWGGWSGCGLGTQIWVRTRLLFWLGTHKTCSCWSQQCIVDPARFMANMTSLPGGLVIGCMKTKHLQGHKASNAKLYQRRLSSAQTAPNSLLFRFDTATSVDHISMVGTSHCFCQACGRLLESAAPSPVMKANTWAKIAYKACKRFTPNCSLFRCSRNCASPGGKTKHCRNLELPLARCKLDASTL